MIRISNLYKRYLVGDLEVPVLNGIDLEIQQGEFVALMGASGSGKTTLMNIIGCLDQLTSGRYYLKEKEISELSSDQRALVRNAEIGFVFQNFNLLRRTSALDNVLMPTQYSKNVDSKSVKKYQERALELLKRVGLETRLDHFPSQLSGGQQQRVAIARALINQPALLLADEPTGNLDSKASAEMLELFKEINTQHGITVVIVTHEKTVGAAAQRIVKLQDGVIVSGADS